jgi:hypothetical protein
MEAKELDNSMISYCGFNCAACPKYTKGQCEGCKGESPKCAVGYKSCQVRPCCIENGFHTCADCDKYASVKECKKYNPFMIRFGQFITRTNRRKGIEMIKEKGEQEFLKFMSERKWVTFKNKGN